MQKLGNTGLSEIVDVIVIYSLGILAALLADYILPRKLKIGIMTRLHICSGQWYHHVNRSLQKVTVTCNVMVLLILTIILCS